jgi:hypothetical protein
MQYFEDKVGGRGYPNRSNGAATKSLQPQRCLCIVEIIMSSRFQPAFFSFRYWPIAAARRNPRMTL